MKLGQFVHFDDTNREKQIGDDDVIFRPGPDFSIIYFTDQMGKSD